MSCRLMFDWLGIYTEHLSVSSVVMGGGGGGGESASTILHAATPD